MDQYRSLQLAQFNLEFLLAWQGCRYVRIRSWQPIQSLLMKYMMSLAQ